MTVDHTLDTDTVRPTSERLLEALQHWRDADQTPSPAALEPELRAIDAHRPVVEHAKGALMLRYGIDSHQAFAVLVRWARVTHTPVHTVAETLVHGICEGSPQAGQRQQPLMRWIQSQLRDNEPDPAPPTPRLPSQRTGR
jgi:hypothetical protein